jgi:hypothetical protein
MGERRCFQTITLYGVPANAVFTTPLATPSSGAVEQFAAAKQDLSFPPCRQCRPCLYGLWEGADPDRFRADGIL